MSRDGTVYWDYSYAFAHGIGVYAVIVSTKSNFRLQPACSCSVHCQQRPVLAINIGWCLVEFLQEGGVENGFDQGRSAC